MGGSYKARRGEQTGAQGLKEHPVQISCMPIAYKIASSGYPSTALRSHRPEGVSLRDGVSHPRNDGKLLFPIESMQSLFGYFLEPVLAGEDFFVFLEWP